MLISKARVLTQVQVVTIDSAPSLRKRRRGSRLIRNANLTAVLTWREAQSGVWGVGVRVVRTG